jgi:hypothetical protein
MRPDDQPGRATVHTRRLQFVAAITAVASLGGATMGSLACDVGGWVPDGMQHGLFSLGDEGDAALRALLRA